MALTTSQLTALKQAIEADAVLNAFPNNSDGAFAIAELLNQIASPDYWVWRTSVSRAGIYNDVSPDGTTWSWTTYKGQTVAEQNAWTQMFMGDTANFSKQNLRDGVAAIFSGSGAPATQRAHITAMGRKKATRIQKIFSSGNGLSATPATMDVTINETYQIQYTDIEQARNS